MVMSIRRIRCCLSGVKWRLSKNQAQFQAQLSRWNGKALFLLAITFLIVLGTIYIISANIILDSFANVERQTVHQNMARVLGLLSNELASLNTTTKDYARWNDTYDFVNGKNDDYVSLNLQSETFISLNLNLIALTGAAQRVTLEADRVTGQVLSASPSLVSSLTHYSSLFSHRSLESAHVGIVILPKGALMIAARPILKSEGESPIAGTLLMGRYFDHRATQQLATLAQVALTSYPFNSKSLPTDVQNARQALVAGDSVVVELLSQTSIAGYTLLKDISGKPAVILRTSTARDIHQQGLLSLRYLAISLLVVGIGSGILIWLLFQKLLEQVTQSDRMRQALERESALRQSDLQYRQKAQELEQTLHTLQETQAQLVQSEKMSSLGQLVAGIAHEINNPINFIYGNISYAQKYWQVLQHLLHLYRHHYPDPVPSIQVQLQNVDLDFLSEDFAKLLDSMKVGSERIRQTVLSLRNFSRLDEAEMKPVDIHEGIENTLLILQNQLKEQSYRPAITLIKAYGELPSVDCYAGQLNQVFMNLLVNAIHALNERVKPQNNDEPGKDLARSESEQPDPELSSRLLAIGNADSDVWQPTIWISTEVVAVNGVTIRIVDNGIGMTAEIRRRLFDPFFTTKPIGKGTGLGLSISYKIIEQHHGQIYCVSVLQQGTEFVLQIPMQQCETRA